MSAIDDNLNSVKFEFDINKKNLQFYSTAKDKRGYETKFPAGILGKYFIAEKKMNK